LRVRVYHELEQLFDQMDRVAFDRILQDPINANQLSNEYELRAFAKKIGIILVYRKSSIVAFQYVVAFS
jgi:hypothetical protein